MITLKTGKRKYLCLELREGTLLARFMQVSNEVGSFLSRLESRENHLGSWDVFLGVLKVLKQCLLIPSDACINEVQNKVKINGIRQGESKGQHVIQ
jgi:hypothetical protein